jgi:DNA-binding response OmpR family regulator
MTNIQPFQQVSNDPPQTIGMRKDLGRLLVIDDDPSICVLIEKLGEKAGFIATRAVSLEDAREAVRARQFDCITLDLGIGKNSGVEVLNILADMACTTPIIIISGSMRSMRDFAVGFGKAMHLDLEQLPKPIDFAVLRAKLSNIKAKLDLERQTVAGV